MTILAMQTGELCKKQIQNGTCETMSKTARHSDDLAMVGTKLSKLKQ